MGAVCRYGCSVAHVRAKLDKGSTHFPDEDQDLCYKHWVNLTPLGSAVVVCVIDDRFAALLLMGEFYCWRVPYWTDHAFEAPYFGANAKCVSGPTNADLSEYKKRRDILLGADFRFSIPSFATGAYCPYPRRSPW